jgi:hypothetical protein
VTVLRKSRHPVFENGIFENGTAPLWKTVQQIGPLRVNVAVAVESIFGVPNDDIDTHWSPT